MKITLLSGLFSLLFLVGCSSSNKESKNGAQPAADAEAQFTSYSEAAAKAKRENKIILVDVYTDWCVWCKRMDKDVYTDAKVKAEMEKYFAAAKLDAESATNQSFKGVAKTEQAIAADLKVSGYPTTVFLSPDEQIIQIVPGYVKAPDFALALRYIGSRAYEKQDFESWRKTQS